MIKTNRNTEIDYEIMIVGGGPAGISTWLHLNKYAPDLAEKTVLIEKAKYPRDKLCGGGVGGWSGFVLKYLGVNLNIPSLFVSDLEFRFGNEISTLHQPNSFRMVRRMEFDNALAENAINRGLQLHENEMFLDMTRKNKFLMVKTNKRKYKVKALIGADGALSIVRRKMKLSNKSHLAPTLEIFAEANSRYDSEFDEKKIVLDFTPIKEGLQGYIWHTPCIKDHKPFIGHGIGDLRFCPDKPKVNMKEIFIRELLSRNIHIEPKLWSSHPIRWFSNEDVISQPNILLVGDAAGIEPATGGGIHFALSYGEVAANTIINAFQINDFSFRDYKQRFRSHLAGKYLAKCTRLANQMYVQGLNPLKVASEVFTIKK
jgi:menaquinone-9 beta-reductase